MALQHLPPQPEATPDRRHMLIGKGWVQGVALVMVFGFCVMGILAYRTYTASMPQPARVVTPSGETLFTSADITAGQELFLGSRADGVRLDRGSTAAIWVPTTPPTTSAGRPTSPTPSSVSRAWPTRTLRW